MSNAGTIGFVVDGVTDAFRDRAALRTWLNGVARDHGTRIDQLTYVLMSDRALLQFNRRYLAHDELTDVITFPVESNNGVAGDVLISYDRVRDNASAFGVGAHHELRRVMVHGLLHLLGHGDKTKAQEQAMRRTEDRYLERWKPS